MKKKKLKDMTVEERRAYDNAKCRKYYRKHREKRLTAVKDRIKRAPEVTKLSQRYRVPEKVIQRHMDESDGTCPLCGRKPSRLSLDHCHKTGKIRGFVCAQCNFGLGHFRDRVDLLKKAIEYLEQRQ